MNWSRLISHREGYRTHMQVHILQLSTDLGTMAISYIQVKSFLSCHRTAKFELDPHTYLNGSLHRMSIETLTPLTEKVCSFVQDKEQQPHYQFIQYTAYQSNINNYDIIFLTHKIKINVLHTYVINYWGMVHSSDDIQTSIS